MAPRIFQVLQLSPAWENAPVRAPLLQLPPRLYVSLSLLPLLPLLLFSLLTLRRRWWCFFLLDPPVTSGCLWTERQQSPIERTEAVGTVLLLKVAPVAVVLLIGMQQLLWLVFRRGRQYLLPASFSLTDRRSGVSSGRCWYWQQHWRRCRCWRPCEKPGAVASCPRFLSLAFSTSHSLFVFLPFPFIPSLAVFTPASTRSLRRLLTVSIGRIQRFDQRRLLMLHYDAVCPDVRTTATYLFPLRVLLCLFIPCYNPLVWSGLHLTPTAVCLMWVIFALYRAYPAAFAVPYLNISSTKLSGTEAAYRSENPSLISPRSSGSGLGVPAAPASRGLSLHSSFERSQLRVRYVGFPRC